MGSAGISHNDRFGSFFDRDTGGRKSIHVRSSPNSDRKFNAVVSGNRVEKSLGTPDRRQAEFLAVPMIAEHKTKLLEA